MMLMNVDDYRRAARRRLPRSVFDVIDGGAGDEVTLGLNRRVFEEIALRPRALADVTTRDLSTTVLGQRVSMPLMLDPCGYARMTHRDAELAVARAAANAGTVYALSTISSYSLEEVAAAATGPKWFQLYAPADREICAALIERVHASGYVALCVTIDGATIGLRERDRRNRLTVPPKITLRHALEGVTHPRWAIDFILGSAGRGAQGMKQAGSAIVATARPITVEDVRFIRQLWSGPLVVKGVQRADECDLLIDLGIDGIVVSNHGGRQLDGVLATMEMLPAVIEAVDGRMEVFVDGGFRRGTDVVKALAFGARAVLVGRPYLFGLAVAGQTGVRNVLEILRYEIDQAMALLGCPTIAAIDASMIHLRPGFAGSRGSVRLPPLER